MNARLLLLCALAFLGCSSSVEERTDARLPVFVSILPQVEFVERVGGDRVRVTALIPPGAEPHDYEPTPGQMAALGNARLYCKVGSGIPFEEIWLEKLRGVNPDLPVVDCAQGIEIVDNDPHIWLSPRLAAKMVANICRGLVDLDPAGRTDYEQNRDRYLRELDALDARLRDSLRRSGVRRFLVYHPSWGYFARAYGLEQLAVEEEGKEPTIQGLGRLIDRAAAEQVGTVFVSPQFDARAARALASEIGARVLQADPLPADYIEELSRLESHLTASRR